jgi:hypothetical protein
MRYVLPVIVLYPPSLLTDQLLSVMDAKFTYIASPNYLRRKSPTEF